MSATLDRSPETATLDALRANAQAREAAGQHAEAAQAWEQLAAGLRGPARAPALVHQARLLAGPLGQPAEAERLYRRALANDPSSPEALEALTRHATAQAQWHLLVNLQRRRFGVTNDPLERARIALEAGRAELEHLESPGAARLWFKRGIQCHPDNQALLEALADLERTSANDAALLDCLGRLIELEGERAQPSALLEAASLHSDLGEHARALGYLQRASRAAPEDSLILDALSDVLSQLDRCGDLADVLERRAALATDDPSTRASTLAELGTLFEERLFDPEAALDAFERAHAADSAAPGVAEGRARLRAKLEVDRDDSPPTPSPPPPRRRERISRRRCGPTSARPRSRQTERDSGSSCAKSRGCTGDRARWTKHCPGSSAGSPPRRKIRMPCERWRASTSAPGTRTNSPPRSKHWIRCWIHGSRRSTSDVWVCCTHAEACRSKRRARSRRPWRSTRPTWTCSRASPRCCASWGATPTSSPR